MLTILYSACNAELNGINSRPGRPKWFNKMDCFFNLQKTIQSCNYPVELIVLMDSDHKNILSNKAEELNYKVIFNNFNSVIKSVFFKFDYAENFSSSDYIYFLEDDYVHTSNALNIMLDGVKTFELISGYDHLDRYTRDDDISFGMESIFFKNNTHWRTAESTTATFMCTKKMLKEILPYAKKHLANDRNFFRELYTKNIRLFTPIPGVSTHVHENFLSPGLDWEKILNDFKN